jgi:transcriptional regulator with XRE-family HTH domain
MTDKEREAIGKRLRFYRRVNDLTQENLAELLDVSLSYVSRIERGVRIPTLTFLYQAGAVLHVSLHELLCDQPSRSILRRSH